MNELQTSYQPVAQNDQRIFGGHFGGFGGHFGGFGRPFGFGRFGFGRPFGFGRFGFGRPFGFGFGAPFLGGLALGGLLGNAFYPPYGYGYGYGYPYGYDYGYPYYPYY